MELQYFKYPTSAGILKEVSLKMVDRKVDHKHYISSIRY